jgi:hypothetical protein
MRVAAACLVAQTLPIAGFILKDPSKLTNDLAIVAYLTSVGLLLSASILLADANSAVDLGEVLGLV